jgi:hypothetical protein
VTHLYKSIIQEDIHGKLMKKTTERLGCGISQCAGLEFGGTIVCNYSPAGNVMGRKPY